MKVLMPGGGGHALAVLLSGFSLEGLCFKSDIEIDGQIYRWICASSHICDKVACILSGYGLPVDSRRDFNIASYVDNSSVEAEATSMGC